MWASGAASDINGLADNVADVPRTELRLSVEILINERILSTPQSMYLDNRDLNKVRHLKCAAAIF
jgi:hypothetical protein